jgi:hypothetical protein
VWKRYGFPHDSPRNFCAIFQKFLLRKEKTTEIPKKDPSIPIDSVQTPVENEQAFVNVHKAFVDKILPFSTFFRPKFSTTTVFSQQGSEKAQF